MTMGRGFHAVDADHTPATELPDSESQFRMLFAEHPVEIAIDDVAIQGRFLYLADPRYGLDSLLDLMVGSAVEFCIPLRQRTGASPSRMEELRKIAARRFIESDAARRNSGEPGELLLFLLLERLMGAPKIASKMSLKTSRNMPVHGCDAVHARLRPGDEVEVELLWGESKIHASLPDAIRDAVGSVSEMQPGSSIREDDIFVIREHIDDEVMDDDLRELLLTLLDPYERETRAGPVLFDRTACFVGFNSRSFEQLRSTDTEAFRNAFLDDYALRVRRACESFADRAKALELGHLDYTLLLLPLDSVAQFRRVFFERLDETR